MSRPLPGLVAGEGVGEALDGRVPGGELPGGVGGSTTCAGDCDIIPPTKQQPTTKSKNLFFIYAFLRLRTSNTPPSPTSISNMNRCPFCKFT